MEDIFSTPFGDFQLSPNPFATGNTDQSIRAWDAADEYILSRLTEPDGPGNILILNDQTGGLSCPLSSHFGKTRKVLTMNQSFNAVRITEENCRRNNLEPPEVHTPDILFSDSFPGTGEVSTVIMKVPRSLPYFEYQLAGLASILPAGTPVIAGGMAKELPISFFETFSKYTEGAEYSLIKKRARLYTGHLKKQEEKRDRPEDFAVEYRFPGSKTLPALIIKSLPGTFSLGKLDPGSAFLLEKLPDLVENFSPKTVADPGCGDGVLGVTAAGLWTEARIICTDDSHQAVKSAGSSAEANGFAERIDLRHTDILEGVAAGSIDLVLCNPPFHSGRRISMDLPFRFISESAGVLVPGGRLLLVANRHLGYLNTLKKHFSRTRIAGENRKYRIYECRR